MSVRFVVKVNARLVTSYGNSLEGKIVEPNTPTSESERVRTGSVVRWADSAQYHQDRGFTLDSTPGSDDGKQGVAPVVRLLSMTPDPLGVIAAMAAMYEGRVVRDLSELTDGDRRRAWDNVLATHLDTPLEAVQLHFLLEGVDRAFTHQLVRQRVGAAYAMESQRFAVVSDLADTVVLPPSLRSTEPGTSLGAEPDQAHWWRNIWDEAIRHVDQAYAHLVDSGMPAEEARGLLPNATATRIHYVTNLRALSEHAGNRTCSQAQHIWRNVFAQIVNSIRNYRPDHHTAAGTEDWEITIQAAVSSTEGMNAWQQKIIADSAIFRPVCYKMNKCPFKASFDRACTIRPKVEALAQQGVPSDQWPEELLREVMINPGAARS